MLQIKNIYQYKINNVSNVTPEHVKIINDTPGKTEITLVTCTDADATHHRTIVHGTYVDKALFNKVTSEMKNAFERKYYKFLFKKKYSHRLLRSRHFDVCFFCIKKLYVATSDLK